MATQSRSCTNSDGYKRFMFLYGKLMRVILHIMNIVTGIGLSKAYWSTGDIWWAGWTLVTILMIMPYSFVTCIDLINYSDYSVMWKCLLALSCIILFPATTSFILLMDLYFDWKLSKSRLNDEYASTVHSIGIRTVLLLAMTEGYFYSLLTLYIACQFLRVGNEVDLGHWASIGVSILSFSFRISSQIYPNIDTGIVPNPDKEIGSNPDSETESNTDPETESNTDPETVANPDQEKRTIQTMSFMTTLGMILTSTSRILMYCLYSMDNMSTDEQTDESEMIFSWPALQLIMVLFIEGFVYFMVYVIIRAPPSLSVEGDIELSSNTISGHTDTPPRLPEEGDTELSSNTLSGLTDTGSQSQLALWISVIATPLDGFTIPGCFISGINLAFSLGAWFLDDIPLSMRKVGVTLSSVVLLINFLSIFLKEGTFGKKFIINLEKIFK